MTRVWLAVFVAALVSACGVTPLVAAAEGDSVEGSRDLAAARKLQSDADTLNEELTRKMLELEVAYYAKKQPLLKERNEMLKAISHFWPTIISKHPNRHSWLKGDDMDILRSLIDVEITDLDSKREGGHYPLHNYRITLRFTPNDYFVEKALWRDVRGGGMGGEGVTSGVTWLEGKAPPQPSFFNFFEASIPDTRARMHEHQKHEIAHVFRYEFWQNPFTYL